MRYFPEKQGKGQQQVTNPNLCNQKHTYFFIWPDNPEPTASRPCVFKIIGNLLPVAMSVTSLEEENCVLYNDVIF